MRPERGWLWTAATVRDSFDLTTSYVGKQLSGFGQQVSLRRDAADASSKLIQMVSTVNGIVPSHSKHRIQRHSRGRGPHRPQNGIRIQVEGPNIIYRVASGTLTAVSERGPSTWCPAAQGTVCTLCPF